MPKAKFKNRLDQLFSEIASENARPSETEAADLGAGLPSGLNPPEAAPAPPRLPEPGEEPDTLSQAKPRVVSNEGYESSPAPAIQYTWGPRGWGEFFDGIRRHEHIGYAYDNRVVKELADTAEEELGGMPMVNAPIQLSGEEIGQILLEQDPNRHWTEDDLLLVNAIAQQLSQQIETLRLLDEAQRSRSNAEQAYLHLSRLSGEMMAEKKEDDLPALLGWAEDGTSLGFKQQETARSNADVLAQILAQADLDEISNPTLSAPLRVGDEYIGNLQIEADQALTDEEANLVETVAQHLAQQMENLRLLDESRHFHRENEEAIRRLTYRSWQAYLSTAQKENLGFQYDHNRVAPLESTQDLGQTTFPLKVREEVIGHLAVDAPVVHEEAAGLIRVITDRLSMHLDGLRLSEQREQALSESETLYGVSSRLSTAQSIEDALASVCEPARDTGARDSRLFFVTLDDMGQPEGLNLAAIWYPEEGAETVPGNSHFLLNDYPVYKNVLADPNNPLLVEDVLTDPRMDEATRDLFTRSGARGMAVLPLSINARWVGVIFINWENPHTFVDQEQRLYASLSRQAAVVVNNRLLLEQTRKRAQELQTVAQVSTAASTILDPEELLQSVVDLTKSSFGLYHVQVYMLRDKEYLLEVVAGSGEIGRQIAAQHQVVPIGSNATAARTARERQVGIVGDVQNEPDFVPNSLLPDVRSEMALPMIIGDRLMGVFNVQASTTNRFAREDARIYTTLASQIAVALQNAESYAEQAATVERLRELDHLKSAFLANMSHELRTPLNSILGFAEVLLLGLDGPINETMDNDIRLIEKNGKHLLSLINDVLDMSKIEAGKMNLTFDKFMLRELMDETLDITGSLAREKSLYLSIAPDSDATREIVSDRVRVRQLLINVVAHAVKFTETGGITIRVVQFPEEKKFQIQVKDTGIGVPEDKLEHIFESFSQVDTSTTRKAGGTGLGLPISRRLVELHGGRLWAESTGVAGEGTTMFIELPVVAVKAS